MRSCFVIQITASWIRSGSLQRAVVGRLGEDLGEQLVLWRERTGLLFQHRDKSQVAEL